ncbi:MAG: ATP synthase F1 subunit gamma [Bryobacteraceae bacterium]
MPSLIDLRRRIRSVKNTQQITKAMKLVSAAKLRKAQDRVIAARPYSGLLRELLANIASAVRGREEVSDALLSVRPQKRIQLVLLSGEKGLAGSFNSNLVKAALVFIAERADAQVVIELIGKKGRDFFRRRPVEISGELVGALNNVRYADAQSVAKSAIERFRNEEIDAVYVMYNEFRSVMSQKLRVDRILPAELPAGKGTGEYLYEQPPAQLLGTLLPRYVEVALFQAMLESAASEHAARMTAMEAATKNAGEMIDKLTLYMNRVRQASITKEIIEVVSGAAASE